MKIYGLVGKNIDYSFSRNYFNDKFKKSDINCVYQNFDLNSIDEFDLLFQTSNEISGLNVTIPYKETVLPHLDGLDSDAKRIGAVNTIKIQNGKCIGFNTDHFGFTESLKPCLNIGHKKALILGTGGASKAVAFALSNLRIPFTFVSRSPRNNNAFSYKELTVEHIRSHQIIINCTPLGTHPNTESCPPIPYDGLTKKHLVYDLIYNPSKTRFLNYGSKVGATVLNGLKMLELQAEKSWKIWNT